MNNKCLGIFYKISYVIIPFGILACLFGCCTPCYSNFFKHLFFGIVLFQIIFWITMLSLDIGIKFLTTKTIHPLNIIIISLLFSILFTSQIDYLNELVKNTSYIEQSKEILIDLFGTIIIFILYLVIFIYLKQKCKWKLYWNN